MHLPLGDWTAISRLKMLRVLSICTLQSSFGAEEARLVPLSLQDLVLGCANTTANTETECVEILKALPPTIRKLDVDGLWPSSISATVAQSMPRSLCALFHRNVAAEAVAFLPDPITSLDVGSLTDNSAISSFPARLRSLTLEYLPDSLAEKLPSQLRSIAVRREISREAVSKLPRSVVQIIFPWLSSANRDIGSLFKALPPALERLKIYKILGTPSAPVPTPSDSSLNLPRSMMSFECVDLDFYGSSLSEWILGLPPRLSSLELFLPQLQKGMMKAVGALSSLSTLLINLFQPPSGGWAQHFNCASLPRSLTYLNLSNTKIPKEASDITDDSFIGAPPGLRRLAIPHAPLLTENCLLHLPSVRILNIQGGPTNPELASRIKLLQK
jgi:hypothetical protein